VLSGSSLQRQLRNAHATRIFTAPGFPPVTRGDEINSAFNYKARLVADRALKSEKLVLAVVFTSRRCAHPSEKLWFRISSKIKLCLRGDVTNGETFGVD
jgi:hypothetical protein